MKKEILYEIFEFGCIHFQWFNVAFPVAREKVGCILYYCKTVVCVFI